MPTTPIIIPVHLDAICAGQDDAQNHLSCFAPPLYDFSGLNIRGAEEGVEQIDRADATAFTSDRVAIQRFSRAVAKPAGVYLHWAMPAALTNGVVKYRITPEVLNELQHEGFPTAILQQLNPSRKDNQVLTVYRSLSIFKKRLVPRIRRSYPSARVSQGEIDWYVSWVCRAASQMTFPTLPDRWLVVRVWTDGPDQPHRAWLIESDFVSSENLYAHDAQYLPSATIPWPFTHDDGSTPEAATQPLYRYLGRVRRLDATWPEGTPERVSRLTAIGYGQAAFAAYLPSCQNVFGHYDCLDDVPLDDSHAAHLLYVVVGWFSRLADDPFDPRRYDPTADCDRTMKPRAVYGLLAQRNWTIPGVEAKCVPDKTEVLQGIARSFYFGKIQGVQWNPRHTYTGSGKLDPDRSHVAMGHSEAEALAAYIAQDKATSGAMTPEEKLEALQLGILKSIQDSSEPEVLLEQALHTSGFHAEDGGTLWRIARHSWGNATGRVAEQFDQKINPAGPAPAGLSPETCRALTRLNRLQRLFDSLQFINQAQRRELFFHWYYYLKWSYGISVEDDAQQYLDQANELLQDLEQLTTAERLPEKIAAALTPGPLSILSRVLGGLARTKLADGPVIDQPLQNLPVLEKVLGEIAGKIIHQAVDLIKLLYPLKDEYQLWVERAPRFFQPNEPHLLIVDDESPESSRFDTAADGSLLCQRLDRLVPLSAQPAIQLTLADDAGGQLNDEQAVVVNRVLAETLAALDQDAAAPAAQVNAWGTSLPDGSPPGRDGVDRGNPWHPVIMEWQATFYGFPRPETGYDSQFITGKTILENDGIDLCYYPGGGDAIDGMPEYTASYDGTIVLSRQAFSTLKAQVDRYLGQCDDVELQDWLSGPPKSVLSQALHGFNAALTTRLRDVQLAVYDPYAAGQQEKEDVQRFRDAIGHYNDLSPKNLAAYNPIRAGYLEINKIRLVDVFGQCRSIENPTVILPQRLQQQPGSNRILLPPRLVQPSRLLFRWLSAAHVRPVEMHSHPDTSPICGWVVSNCLDDSLMIYSRDGTFLGSIREGSDPQADHPQWESAPGVPTPQPMDLSLRNIPDTELRRFVAGFLSDSRDNFRIFQEKIERVLLIIEPQNEPQQDALAVLMGRPLALVQAMLGLELKGPPACRLDEDSYAQYLLRGRLADDNYPAVQFPIRLGDLSSGNDGLVGYFQANASGRIFYNLSTFHSENLVENQPDDQADNILLTSSERVIVSMLVDPRASVHATSGILPVKSIDIPPDQYADSLRRMAFTFDVHPVLSPGKLRLPLPAESDQAWTWLSKTKEGWQPPVTEIGKIAEGASFGRSTPLQILEGWLQVNPLVTKEQSQSTQKEANA